MLHCLMILGPGKFNPQILGVEQASQLQMTASAARSVP